MAPWQSRAALRPGGRWYLMLFGGVGFMNSVRAACVCVGGGGGGGGLMLRGIMQHIMAKNRMTCAVGVP